MGRLLDSLRTQSVLKISPAHGEQEREADRVAEQVVRGDAPAQISGTFASSERGCLQRKCANCEEDEEKAKLQRKESGDGPGIAPPIVHEVLNSPGEPLDAATRAFFEPRFGHDFSNVRIHAGSTAAASASSVNALAYTVGERIVFTSGQFSPHTRFGQYLLAHELAHVVQQSGGPPWVQRLESGETDTATTDPPSLTTSTSQASAIASRVASPDQETQREIILAVGVLQRLPPLTDQEETKLAQILRSSALYPIILEKRKHQSQLQEKQAQLEVIKPEHGVPEPGSMLSIRVGSLSQEVNELTARVGGLEEQVRQGLAALGLDSEEDLMRLVDEQFPQIFIERAKQVVETMLSQNEEMVRLERGRYSQQVSSPDIEGLLQADRKLASIDAEIKSLEISVDIGQRNIPSAGVPDESSLPPESASIAYEVRHLTEHREQLAAKQLEYRRVLSDEGLRFPILFAPAYRVGTFAQGSPEQLSQLVGQPINDILENIQAVREAVQRDELKVWNLRGVIEITIEDMGVEGDPVLMSAVQAAIARQVSDDQFVAMAGAALAVTATVVAGLVAGPLGAGLVGGVTGGFALARDVREFQIESAAQHVALDPVVAEISTSEPSLKWIVLDVAALGLDVAQIVGALRPLARALSVTRDADSFTRFAAGVRAVLPEATAEALIARAGRRFAQASLKSAGVARLGEALLRRIPELRNLGLDAKAIERALLKAPDVGQIKGQLLEELLGVRVRSMITGEAGRAALAGPSAGKGALEFIPGHLITDKAGRQFTDGILALRQPDGALRVVAIFEAKAGEAAGRGLWSVYTSIKDLSAPELEEARAYAIDILREENPALAGLSANEIAQRYPAELHRMIGTLPRTEAGQVRRTLERLLPSVGRTSTELMIDGKATPLVGTLGTARVIGVLPSDVNIRRMTAAFAQEGISFEPMNMAIGQTDLQKLAEQLAQQAKLLAP